MPESFRVPMFPLTLLPLPGELVPLHIFEPRYKELLQDAETLDISFGIYCTHELNKEKLGSLMKLESIIKRYSTGEADIVVRCVDTFSVEKLFRIYKSRTYPGGEVKLRNVDLNEMPGIGVYELFLEYQSMRNINSHYTSFNIYQVAQELNFDLFERYRFLTASPEKRDAFLASQLKFQIHVLQQEVKSKDVYHLN